MTDTTPAPPLTALLDQLDQLRAAATPGPWLAWDAPDVTAIAAGVEHTPSGTPINPKAWVVDGASGLTDADAALIVAAVNAVPQLTTALRAVLQLADDVERDAVGSAEPNNPESPEHVRAAALFVVAHSIRAAIGGDR